MREIFLLLGANLGDRELALNKALTLLAGRCGSIVAKSPLFETAAWGRKDQPSFLNQAVELKSEMTAEQLMQAILEIEKHMGRVRQEKYGARIIDIDIIFFSKAVINLKNLSVPHPQMQNRRFVLVPLNEIAPGFIHPIFNKSVSELLIECDDELEVRPFTNNPNPQG